MKIYDPDSINRKIFECDLESRYRNLSKIRNVSFNSQNFKIKFQKREKKLKKFT